MALQHAAAFAASAPSEFGSSSTTITSDVAAARLPSASICGGGSTCGLSVVPGSEGSHALAHQTLLRFASAHLPVLVCLLIVGSGSRMLLLRQLTVHPCVTVGPTSAAATIRGSASVAACLSACQLAAPHSNSEAQLRALRLTKPACTAGMGPLDAHLLGPDALETHKVLFMAPEERILEIRSAAEDLLGDKASLTRALSGMLEVLPPGANKGAGAARVLQDLGIEPGEIMAIGDGENDVELLQLAKVSTLAAMLARCSVCSALLLECTRTIAGVVHATFVQQQSRIALLIAHTSRMSCCHSNQTMLPVQLPVAMGNASSRLKEHATVLVPSNDENGVAVAIHNLLDGAYEQYM